MGNIMLVEDDLIMIGLLETLLDIEGFQVIKVSDFTNVVENVRENRPDLILLDVNLPDVSGLDILETIRQDEELKHISVIMSSGMDLGDKCRRMGANDFLMKPYMPDELIKKIKLHLQDEGEIGE